MVKLSAIQDSRSQLALSRVRAAAAHSGAAKLSLPEINREIAAARKARRAPRRRTA